MMPNYHESRTPQEHIDAVKAAVADLKKFDFVVTSHVDDWGRFSNFSVFITVKMVNKHNPRNWRGSLVLQDPQGLQKIKSAILESLKTKVPGIKVKIRKAEKEKGSNTYNLDVDFFAYDAASNTFPEKMPA